MNIILADIDKKRDGKCFNLTSNQGQKIKLKAQSDDEREKWIKCFKKINHIFFPAGIDQEMLTLALEPEAAALCCKCLEIQKRTTGKGSKLGSFDTGARFLVVDLGETKGVSTILLVGGYAACDLLKDAMKTKFSNLTVICPLDPDVVVLKGAVIMGHMETPIVGRIAKCHYGIAILVGVDKQNMYQCFDRSFKPLTSTEEEFHTIIKKETPDSNRSNRKKIIQWWQQSISDQLIPVVPFQRQTVS
ncbi:unnamed protein product [Mytilus edulis]|uniref:PH domain-containing protein n=1 Tax=Mytilus edulis TaxID=6550 RepID=A0A8S3TRS8_MYTED|nr:unnamed protein product [Mytilus edulis]